LGWKSFIIELVKALAWPTTLLFIFGVIRKPLLSLFPLLARFKVKDFEFDFRRRLEETVIEAAALPAPDIMMPMQDGNDRLRKIIEASPRAAILEAWINLEHAAIEAARRKQVDLPYALLRTPLRLIEYLEETGVIDSHQANIYNQLRGLRNSAAHAQSFEPSKSAAGDYVELAAKLERLLKES
jgi:hypothetical protein